MANSVFAVKEYRDFLRQQLEAPGSRGLITRLAEAAQCQRSHISRVVSGLLHLTPEQAFRLTRFFALSEDETEFFMKLVEYERSGDPDYRANLQRRLKQLRQAQENLGKRLREPQIGEQGRETLYYSSWQWSAIHILVSIPQYQTPAAIAQRLSLPRNYVESCLRQLEEFALVRQERGHWKIATGSLHLPKNSPLNSVQHANWRIRAVTASQLPQEDGVHYTVVQSLSEADFERVKQLVLSTIDSYQKIAKPSREEELVCLTCDFFRV